MAKLVLGPKLSDSRPCTVDHQSNMGVIVYRSYIADTLPCMLYPLPIPFNHCSSTGQVRLVCLRKISPALANYPATVPTTNILSRENLPLILPFQCISHGSGTPHSSKSSIWIFTSAMQILLICLSNLVLSCGGSIKKTLIPK